jgi:hypothetical protein
MAADSTIGDGWGDPTAERNEHSGAWMHVPARGKLVIVILSRAPVRYRGHWIGSRMRMCAGARCVYCEQRRGVQVRYCFSVLDASTRTQGLIEVGAAAAEAIWTCAQQEGRLRGLAFALRKEQQRDRGRILVTQEATLMAVDLLPEAEEIRPHLQRQWADAEGIPGVMDVIPDTVLRVS